jgi:hypothetical protein
MRFCTGRTAIWGYLDLFGRVDVQLGRWYTVEPPRERITGLETDYPMSSGGAVSEGLYVCRRGVFSVGQTWEITGVDNRRGITFHDGSSNQVAIGSILLGEELGDTAWTVTRSREALERFRSALSDTPRWILEIRHAQPSELWLE